MGWEIPQRQWDSEKVRRERLLVISRGRSLSKQLPARHTNVRLYSLNSLNPVVYSVYLNCEWKTIGALGEAGGWATGTKYLREIAFNTFVVHILIYNRSSIKWQFICTMLVYANILYYAILYCIIVFLPPIHWSRRKPLRGGGSYLIFCFFPVLQREFVNSLIIFEYPLDLLQFDSRSFSVSLCQLWKTLRCSLCSFRASIEEKYGKDLLNLCRKKACGQSEIK